MTTCFYFKRIGRGEKRKRVHKFENAYIVWVKMSNLPVADFNQEITILLQIHSTRYLTSSSRKFSYKSTLRIYIFHFHTKNLLRATERRFCIDPNFASLRRSAFSRFNRAWQKKQFVANDHCFRFERSFNEKSWS